MINTTLCYLEKDNSYLMLHRIKKKNDVNHDKWIGIGGKFEEGESPEECIVREVQEETGLILKNYEYRGIVTFVSRENESVYYELMHLFWSDSFCNSKKNTGNDGEQSTLSLIDCDEGFLEWVPKNTMNNLPHWKGDEIFLKLIDEKVPFFSLKLLYENGELVDAVLNGKKYDIESL